MSIIRKLKERTKDKKIKEDIALRIMLDFVHGKMTTREFWGHYKSNESIRKLLIKDKTIPKYAAHLDPGNQIKGREKIAFTLTGSELFLYYHPVKLLERVNIDKLRDRDALFWIVRTYFTRRKEQFEVKNEDAKLYRLINVIQPDWLRPEEFDNLLDEDFLINIVFSAPENLSEELKEQWCKNRLLELFKFDSKPPEWLLFPQWPIVDGKPLVFDRQENDKNNDSRVLYHFYNSETKEKTVIEQLL